MGKTRHEASNKNLSVSQASAITWIELEKMHRRMTVALPGFYCLTILDDHQPVLELMFNTMFGRRRFWMQFL